MIDPREHPDTAPYTLDTPSTASPQRDRPQPSTTQRKPHLLKNGHPAHVLTTEERRKGAARTNAIRRMRREAADDEMFERAVAELNGRAWRAGPRSARRSDYAGART